ncbi:hypothetical protein BDW59DRAFT_159027 [Aspergillus cavernicola]|uniref:Zn(2)-C6 fungal-type domain-containing protein n=1 Tax=Aspergillus cavernicola TaxID=176166 RepID=A0ABR4IP26_9EURO
MNASIQRRRLACAECTRMKVKCDKVVPCRNCMRRGTSCYRNPQRSSYPPATPVSRSQVHDESSAGGLQLEGNITSCIQELQATLRAVRQGKSSAPNFNGSTVSLPPSPAQQSARVEQAESEVIETSLPETIPASSGPSKEAAEVEDAATILEFLAWGRRKVQAYDDLDRDPNGGQGQSPGDVALDDSLNHDETSPLRLTVDSSSLTVLQLLLPEPHTLLQIIKYHCDCLLWYHTSFHALVFQKELSDFLHRHNSHIDDANVDLQWVALLFAVLAGSMACAPPAVAHSWGFRDQERCTIARRWFKAALICLHRADYSSNHSIYAVECVATMTISAHMLGHSNSHSVMLATAVRIAQTLGLHRLGSGAQDTPNNMVRKEIGRRVWTELCIQDWFSVPFSESYLIHLLDFNTATPQNCREEDMVSLPDDVPTSMTYHRLLYQIARLMPRLQDDLAQSNTLYTKYEHVLQYDTKMRTLASEHVPLWLKNTTPLDPSWPRYVPWARHCLTISSAHKIIMIHRKFLWPSFTNPAFSFTRKTCIAASKTIVRECKQVAEEDGPVLWIYHAFGVAASIILCLDLLFRSPSDTENQGHRDLVQDTVTILSRSETSMIAQRGVTILRLLCRVEQNRISSQGLVTTPMSPDEQQYALDIRKLVQAVCEQKCPGDVESRTPLVGGTHLGAQRREPLQAARQREQLGAGSHVVQSPDSSFAFQGRGRNADELLGNLLGPQARFEIHDSLEDILFLAQNCDTGYE